MDFSDLDIQIVPEYTMHKKINKNLYLSLEEIDILNKYDIDYKNKTSLSELIYEIESIGDNELDDDILNLLDLLAERDYYENFKK